MIPSPFLRVGELCNPPPYIYEQNTSRTEFSVMSNERSGLRTQQSLLRTDHCAPSLTDAVTTSGADASEIRTPKRDTPYRMAYEKQPRGSGVRRSYRRGLPRERGGSRSTLEKQLSELIRTAWL